MIGCVWEVAFLLVETPLETAIIFVGFYEVDLCRFPMDMWHEGPLLVPLDSREKTQSCTKTQWFIYLVKL